MHQHLHSAFAHFSPITLPLFCGVGRSSKPPFLPQQTGYIGIGFGSGTQFNYGWIEFTVYEQGSQNSMVMTGWAYNDVVNESITVGQIPAPGAFALLAMGGLVGRRRRL